MTKPASQSPAAEPAEHRRGLAAISHGHPALEQVPQRARVFGAWDQAAAGTE